MDPDPATDRHVGGRAVAASKPTFTEAELVGLTWRTADDQEVEGAVEVARTGDGWILMRRRGHPEEGVVVFTPAEMDAWIKGCKAGEFDDIAGHA